MQIISKEVTALAAVIIIVVILAILAIVGIVFANGISVFYATSILSGIVLFYFAGIAVINPYTREKAEKRIERVNVFDKVRTLLVNGIGFSISETAQKILILIMSAASVAIVVRAVIFVVNALIASAAAEDWDSMGWLFDLMGDAPVLNVLVLLRQGAKAEYRPDFFVVALLLSLFITAVASAVVQLIMAPVNKLITEAKEDSILFRILGGFSVTTLIIAGTMFLSSLISPLIDLSKPWDGFGDFFRPFLSSSFGNFLLQVLVTVVMFAVLVILCFDWMQMLVMGVAGLFVSLLIELLSKIFFSIFMNGTDFQLTAIYVLLLCFLYPVIDILKNLIFKDNRTMIWLPVAVPLVLSVIFMIVSVIIGKANEITDFERSLPIPVISLALLVFSVYMLAMPTFRIVREAGEE